MRARTPVLILALLLGAPAGAQEDADRKDDEARLAALRSRIAALQGELNDTAGKRDAVREELHALEREIGAVVRASHRLRTRLGADQRRVARLERRAAEEAKSLARQQRSLAAEARIAYMLGGQAPLKLLLNQDDPASIARALAYFRYFSEARLARINEGQQKLSVYARLKREIEAGRADVDERQDELTRQRRELESVQRRRNTLLTSLNREVADRSQAIVRLKADEARLERLLSELGGVLPDPPVLDPGARFDQQRGRLPLPVEGRIRARFGDPKPVGRLNWRGIFIESEEGREIRAIHRGRVAYADWLRGFGLLLIMDHGNGYMTLFGHNQGLHKEPGQWVEAGETIASVGSTGDAPAPGVYFEIRERGQPRDPLAWCQARRAAGIRPPRR